MSTTITNVEVLRAAAALLEERGWHPIGHHSPTGSLSLVGALMEATRSMASDRVPATYTRAYGAVIAQLERTPDSTSFSGPVLWNLYPHRTEGDVITLLRSAAMTEELAPDVK